ncbi:MAG: hypothetical protein COB53_00115 [Elusimicrobia bacterium]|nr:MAG: hypothetical protein COB53_00115 [Elusimicrobiota bacterium]
MAEQLYAGLIFGLIGMAAFGYGKKQGKPKPMIVGALLCGYPYVITHGPALWIVGMALTAALFLKND